MAVRPESPMLRYLKSHPEVYEMLKAVLLSLRRKPPAGIT